MKLHLLIILVLMFSFSVFGQNAVVIITKASFRERPSPNAKVIFLGNKGAKLKLISDEHTNGWYYVSNTRNLKGWVYGDAIEISYSASASTQNSKVNKWIRVGETSDSEYFVNPSRVQFLPSSRKFWQRTQNSNGNISSMIFKEVRCSTWEFRVLQGSDYDSKGKTIGPSLNLTYSSFNQIIPESIGEAVAKYICRLKK